MSQNRFSRIALYATAGIGLLLVLAVVFFAVEQRRTHAETGAVLSALFTQRILDEAKEQGAGRKIEIVILRNPSCLHCPTDASIDLGTWFGKSLKSRKNSLFNPWFAQSSPITRTSFFVNSLVSADISTDLTLPLGARVVFVDAKDLGKDASDFAARFPNSFGYFVVSDAGMNLNETEALLYIDHFCGGLCGGGDYVLLRKINGTWRVIDSYFAWIS
jgi:hypothetical protein